MALDTAHPFIDEGQVDGKGRAVKGAVENVGNPLGGAAPSRRGASPGAAAEVGAELPHRLSLVGAAERVLTQQSMCVACGTFYYPSQMYEHRHDGRCKRRCAERVAAAATPAAAGSDGTGAAEAARERLPAAAGEVTLAFQQAYRTLFHDLTRCAQETYDGCVEKYVQSFFEKLGLLLCMTVGYWHDGLVRAAALPDRARALDPDLDDEHDEIEDVARAIGLTHTMIWQFYPGTVILAKLGEALNDDLPLLDDKYKQKEEDGTVNNLRRWRGAAFSLVNYAFTLGMVFFPSVSLYRAWLIVLMPVSFARACVIVWSELPGEIRDAVMHVSQIRDTVGRVSHHARVLMPATAQRKPPGGALHMQEGL